MTRAPLFYVRLKLLLFYWHVHLNEFESSGDTFDTHLCRWFYLCHMLSVGFAAEKMIYQNQTFHSSVAEWQICVQRHENNKKLHNIFLFTPEDMITIWTRATVHYNYYYYCCCDESWKKKKMFSTFIIFIHCFAYDIMSNFCYDLLINYAE